MKKKINIDNNAYVMFHPILTCLCRKTTDVPSLTMTCNPRFLLRVQSSFEYISSQLPSSFHIPDLIRQCIHEYCHYPDQCDDDCVYVTVFIHTDVIPSEPCICFPEFIDLCFKLGVENKFTEIVDNDMMSRYLKWSSVDRLHEPFYNSDTRISYTSSGYIWCGDPITPKHIHRTHFEIPGHVMTYKQQHINLVVIVDNVITFIRSISSQCDNRRRIFDGRKNVRVSMIITQMRTHEIWKRLLEQNGFRVRSLVCKKDFKWLHRDIGSIDIVLVSETIFTRYSLFVHKTNITGGMFRFLLTVVFDCVVYETGMNIRSSTYSVSMGRHIHKSVVLMKQLCVGQYTLIIGNNDIITDDSFLVHCIYLFGSYQNSIPLTPEPVSIYTFSYSTIHQKHHLKVNDNTMSRLQTVVRTDRIVYI